MSNNLEEITSLFEQQKQACLSYPYLSKEDRVKKLLLLLQKIYEKQHEIEEAIYKDFGKPAVEVKMTETLTVISEIKYALKNLTGWMKFQKAKTPLTLFGATSKITFEPKGVCLIISPWNYPFQLTFSPLVSAIAAGNRVIIKPSEFSNNTSKLIKSFINEIFDSIDVEVFEGDYKVAQKLLSLPFDHIFFTGSPNVGKIVMESASKNLTSVTLELGGKSPVIIDKSANLDLAAKRIVWGKLVNAGQTCIAPDYALVSNEINKEFVEKLIYYINKFYGKNIKNNSDYCKIINDNNYNRLMALINDAVAKGGILEFGGGAVKEQKFIEPTIISNLNFDSEILNQEIFGPILPIIEFNTKEEIYSFVNKNPKPLALYIFSTNKKFVNEILKNISSGGCSVNDVVLHFANHYMPFGGVNNSGIGKAHGFYGFKEFSNEKSILTQSRFSAIDVFYPPYTEKTKKIAAKIIKYL